MKLLTACGVALLLGWGTASCHAPSSEGRHEHAAVLRAVEQLYASFCFDAGGQADWTTMQALCHPEAQFVAPYTLGAVPQVARWPQFQAEFQAYITSAPQGVHERVLHTRIDRYGTIAQAFVTFEAYVPATGVLTGRGVDSIQFVLVGNDWKLLSFTTQYETSTLPLPPV